jgi:mRNA interferase HigB
MASVPENDSMHVFSRPKLRKAATDYPDAAASLNVWFKIAERARWENIHQVRQEYPHANLVGSCVVFNISGNKSRLITRIFYAPDEFRGHAYVLHVLTHKEYDADKWKADCDCG